MRNKYSFEFLKKNTLSSLEEEGALFFKMQHVVRNGEIKCSFNKLDELFDVLTHSNYYIAHNLVGKRGKEMFFKGRLFISRKNDLVSFVNKSVNNNDMRCFLISPMFLDVPEFVVYLDEDQILLYSF